MQTIREHLGEGRPVVIDFTIEVEREGEVERHGHTLLVVGCHAAHDRFVMKNPNQPPPGIQILTASELNELWYSRGYSRLAKGQASRPLIVVDD